MPEFDFLEEKNIIKAFEKHKPYLLDVEKLIKELGYGRLSVEFTIKDASVISMSISGVQLIRYDKGERARNLDKD